MSEPATTLTLLLLLTTLSAAWAVALRKAAVLLAQRICTHIVEGAMGDIWKRDQTITYQFVRGETTPIHDYLPFGECRLCGAKVLHDMQVARKPGKKMGPKRRRIVMYLVGLQPVHVPSH